MGDSGSVVLADADGNLIARLTGGPVKVEGIPALSLEVGRRFRRPTAGGQRFDV